MNQRIMSLCFPDWRVGLVHNLQPRHVLSPAARLSLVMQAIILQKHGDSQGWLVHTMQYRQGVCLLHTDTLLEEIVLFMRVRTIATTVSSLVAGR